MVEIKDQCGEGKDVDKVAENLFPVEIKDQCGEVEVFKIYNFL